MEFKLKSLKVDISVNKIANLHFFEFEKNFFTKSDKHPFCELVFVSSGTLLISSEDFNGKLVKNEMIIHRANTPHFLTCTAENAPTVIIIGFECNSDKMNYFSSRPVTLSEQNVKKLAEIVKEGRNVFSPPYNIPTYDMIKKKQTLFGSEQLLKNLLEYFLIQIIREYNFNQTSDDNYGEPFNLTVNEIINYVDHNFLEKITIDELAFLFCTNRATLCKEFKKTTGKTLIEYVNAKKIALATDMITKTNKTFTEIAYDLNFETIHYFTRFFKKQTGISPKEFRLTHRNE